MLVKYSQSITFYNRWRSNFDVNIEYREKKMKQFITILSAFLLGLSLIYYFVFSNSSKNEVFSIEQSRQFISPPINTTMAYLAKNKPGIYYFGFKRCPWCQELLPVLDEVLQEEKLSASAVDTKDKSFTKKHRTELEAIYKKYETGNLSVPFLIIIDKYGIISTHVGTLNNHDATKNKMTTEQKKKLKKILRKMVTN